MAVDRCCHIETPTTEQEAKALKLVLVSIGNESLHFRRLDINQLTFFNLLFFNLFNFFINFNLFNMVSQNIGQISVAHETGIVIELRQINMAAIDLAHVYSLRGLQKRIQLFEVLLVVNGL
jgi:hypothetical protein